MLQRAARVGVCAREIVYGFVRGSIEADADSLHDISTESYLCDQCDRQGCECMREEVSGSAAVAVFKPAAMVSDVLDLDARPMVDGCATSFISF